ncbi:hypothetical protein ACFV3R_11780 [Streptomyces sp. NPDC059740]|uniref:hypothetical protein n=1 Tax=Streptomyces sp. NPDC059740 TaxID=3346926 RepID=UPI00365B369D
MVLLLPVLLAVSLVGDVVEVLHYGGLCLGHAPAGPPLGSSSLTAGTYQRNPHASTGDRDQLDR